jgi:hypothetical protein
MSVPRLIVFTVSLNLAWSSRLLFTAPDPARLGVRACRFL